MSWLLSCLSIRKTPSKHDHHVVDLTVRSLILALITGISVGAESVKAAPFRPVINSNASATTEIGKQLLQEIILGVEASSVVSIDMASLGELLLENIKQDFPQMRLALVDDDLEVEIKGQRFHWPWPPRNGAALIGIVTGILQMTSTNNTVPLDAAQKLSAIIVKSIGDPFTAYITPTLVAKLDTRFAAQLAAPGIELFARDPMRVREVRPGSDAARQGLLAGDRIVEVDGKPCKNSSLAEISANLLGPENTFTDLLVYTSATGTTQHMLVQRTLIPPAAVTTAMLPNQTLYIRIPLFYSGMARSVGSELLSSNYQNIILDLRHNQGGLVEEAVELLDLFFADGSIGGVRSRPGRPESRFAARFDQRDVLRKPIAILVDGGSASATEMFALVMQERGRAVVLGAPTLGKGSVQRMINLPDGGILRLTVAYYVGAKDMRLDEGGVQPQRFLARTQRRTVLENAEPDEDGWVLAALDALRQCATCQNGEVKAKGPQID